MDTPETLAAALLASAAEAVVATRVAVQKSALNIKTRSRANVLQSAPTRNAHAANTITYDTKIGKTGVEAEIGYDKDLYKAPGRQTGPGGIGNLLEFGGGGDHSPPHRDLARALEAEEPGLTDSLQMLAKRLL